MSVTFQRATREKVYLKIALMGPSGAGKTWSALLLAEGLADGGKIALLDTENRSASLYADLTEFDTIAMEAPFEPKKAIEVIDAAVAGGYKVLVIDSATHFWKWILELKAMLDSKGGNQYTNWDKAKPHFDRLKTAMLQAPIHIVACLRAKDDYVMETNSQGKQAPKKVGMGAIMEPGAEYEYTVVFELGMDHVAVAGVDGRGKDRTGLFADTFAPITVATGTKMLDWLKSGAEPSKVVYDANAIVAKWELDKATADDLKVLTRSRGMKLSEAIVLAAEESTLLVRDSQTFARWVMDTWDAIEDEDEGNAVPKAADAVSAADSVADAPADADPANLATADAKKHSPRSSSAKREDAAA